MNFLKSLFVLTFFVIISTIGISQDRSVVMESSNDTLLFGNYFELSITYNNIEASKEPIYFEDFTIQSNPNVSSQYQNINGEVSQSTSYSYYLEANKTGVFIIPAIKVEHEDHVIASQEITVVVLPNPEGIITTPTRKQNSFFFDWSTPDSQSPPILAPPTKPDPLRKKRKKI